MDEKIWYLPDDKNMEAIGPYSVKEIISLYKEESLLLEDYISSPHKHDGRWVRILDVIRAEKDFYPILDMFKKKPICPPPKQFTKGKSKVENEVTELNFYVNKDESYLALVHDESSYSSGRMIKLSFKEMQISFLNDVPWNNCTEVDITVYQPGVLESFSIKGIVSAVKREVDNTIVTMGILRIGAQAKMAIKKRLMAEVA